MVPRNFFTAILLLLTVWFQLGTGCDSPGATGTNEYDATMGDPTNADAGADTAIVDSYSDATTTLHSDVIGQDDETPAEATGALKVHWLLPGTDTCRSSGVAYVEAIALQSDIVISSARSSCSGSSNSGAVTIQNLVPGNYEIIVDAFDDDDVGRHAGATDALVRDESISETEAVQLQAKPISLRVTWTAPTGSCEPYDAPSARVTLYAPGLGMVEGTTGCLNSDGVLFDEAFAVKATTVTVQLESEPYHPFAEGESGVPELHAGPYTVAVPITLCPGNRCN